MAGRELFKPRHPQGKENATVPIDCRSYDVPMQFISQKVDIRYLLEDMDSAFINY